MRNTFSLPVSAAAAAAATKSLQSCPTLCDPMDGSPTGSSVHGIFEARVLEWGAIAFSAVSRACLMSRETNDARGFPGGASGKEPTCQCRRRKRRGVQSLGRKDPLKGMATHSSILTWRSPRTEEPGGLQSIGSHIWTPLK